LYRNIQFWRQEENKKERKTGRKTERKGREKERLYSETPAIQRVANRYFKIVFGGQRLFGTPANTSCKRATGIKQSTAEPLGISLTNYRCHGTSSNS